MAAPEASHEKTYPGEGTYLTVFMALAALTVIELTVIALPGLRYPLLIGLAFAKAWLVIQYYMHLRYDNRLFTWVFLIPVGAGVLMTVFLQALVR
jgi:cytochrome c oxidase subunit 4